MPHLDRVLRVARRVAPIPPRPGHRRPGHRRPDPVRPDPEPLGRVRYGLVAVVVAFAPCLLPPVDAPVSDPFRAPTCTWCPGNRGIEYATRPGQPVQAAAAGTVTFVGPVARTVYVVVEHADGLRATYGRLATVRVARGARVRVGQVLGTTSDAFYFGLRDGDRAVDPTPLLGRTRWPTRLVPVDGTPAPSPGPGRLVCPAGVRSR